SAIIQYGGWRWAFLWTVPVGLAAVVIGKRVLAESRDSDARDVPDVVGAILLMAGIGLLALGLVRGRDWAAPAVLACLAAALALLAWFWIRSRKVPSPALDVSLFESKSFLFANIATLVFGATFSAMFLGSVLFLTGVWGYSILQAGLGMSPGPLLVMAVAPVTGRLGGRLGHRPLIVPGGMIFALGFLWRYLATSPTPHYVAEWLPPMVLSGIGVGLVLPALAGASTWSLPPNRFAVGSGANPAIPQIGAVPGVGAVVAPAGSAHGPGALRAFTHVFLLLALGGLSTAMIAAAIDTRPRVLPAGGGQKETPDGRDLTRQPETTARAGAYR